MLIAPTRIKGTVVDGRSGQPIPRFSLSYGTVRDRGRPLIWQSRDGIDKESKKAAGSFEYTIAQPTHQCVRARLRRRLSVRGLRPVLARRQAPVVYVPPHPRGADPRHRVESDGSPAVDGFVYLVPAAGEDTLEFLDIQNGDVSSYERTRSIHAKIGADGRFSIPSQKGDFTIVALSGAGFVIVRRSDLRGDDMIHLRPWARVSGTVMLDGKPAANLGLSSFDPDDTPRILGEPRIENRSYVETDADGRFELSRVMPGRLVLGRTVPNGVANRIWIVAMATVDVESGKTYELKIGAAGAASRAGCKSPIPASGWFARRRSSRSPRRRSGPHRSASTSPMTAASAARICLPAIMSYGSRSTSPRRTMLAAGGG